MKYDNPWLDGMHAHSKSLLRLAAQLRDLGNAFDRTGNEALSVELWDMARTAQEESKRADALTGDKVSSDYKEAVQGTANVLRATLAGMTVATKEMKNP